MIGYLDNLPPRLDAHAKVPHSSSKAGASQSTRVVSQPSITVRRYFR
jgi:hypothetical protein